MKQHHCESPLKLKNIQYTKFGSARQGRKYVIFQFRITVKVLHQFSREEMKNSVHFLFLLSLWQEAIYTEKVTGLRMEITEI